jgi:hypothetical protein
MTLRIFALIAIGALGVQAQDHGRMIVGYPDGTGLELYAESTGTNTATLTKGSGILWEGHIYRVVEDGQGHVLFSYEIEAVNGTARDGLLIRLKPTPPGLAADRQQPGRAPTVSAVREFRVKQGEALKFDILHNATTGETIYDVLRPTALVEPYPKGISISYRSTPGNDQFTLQDPKIVANGEEVDAPPNRMVGKAMRVSLLGHGCYILALEKTPRFSQSAFVDRNKLIVVMDGDYIQITSRSNILATTERASVWVYHDAGCEPATELKRKIAELEGKLEEYLRVYRETMPEVTTVRARIQQMKSQLDAAVIVTGDKAEALMGGK